MGGTGPSKKELRFWMAECRARKTGDPKVLQDPMLDMPGADEFNTRDPHMAGEEVFGSMKRKLDLPLELMKSRTCMIRSTSHILVALVGLLGLVPLTCL